MSRNWNGYFILSPLQASANSIISGLIKYYQSIKAGLFKYEVVFVIDFVNIHVYVYNIQTDRCVITLYSFM